MIKLKYFDEKVEEIKRLIREIYHEIIVNRQRFFEKEREFNIIESQQKTIDNLTDALCEKYKQGLLVMYDGKNDPVIIKDGENIMNTNVSRFDIDWSKGEIISLSVDYQ